MSFFTACFRKRSASTAKQIVRTDEGEGVSDVVNVKLYSYKELQVATEEFSSSNKIGEGGFGPVFKGTLKDGRLVALKVLSAKSSQGLQQFLTEIMVISNVKHENLVKLYGCCVEGNNRILVYGYLENSSLDRTLLGRSGHSRAQFNWRTRTKICIGIARGLAFLHEEVHPHIIHRDIKASNILLDKDLTPRISDFGLAKLFPPNLTHISTRVAGTLGYLAPEYAMGGQLTRKADIYSFGVLLLEIVSGRCNTNKQLPIEEQYLLERAWELYEKGELVGLVDTSLEENFDVDDACKYLKIALLCTQDSPKIRPAMSTVVKMLDGELDVSKQNICKPGLISDLMDLKCRKSYTSYPLTDGSSKLVNTSMTTSIMTFTSIYDQSSS